MYACVRGESNEERLWGLVMYPAAKPRSTTYLEAKKQLSLRPSKVVWFRGPDALTGAWIVWPETSSIACTPSQAVRA